MRGMPLFRISRVKTGSNPPHCWHGRWLSILRVLAALEVAAGHLRSELFPGLRTLAHPPLAYQLLAFVTGFAHQGVVLLFLISGWLVGGRLLDTIGEPGALKRYAVDRLTRLWTVLIPVMVLTLLIGLAVGHVDVGTIDVMSAREFSGLTLIGNLFGLQNIAVVNFGGNYALWTLAHQSWYYVLFPLCLLVARGALLTRAVCALAIVAIAVSLPAPMLMYFSLWLLGAACSRMRIDCAHGVRASLAVCAAGAAVYCRLFGWKDDLIAASLPQDLAFGLLTALFLCSARSGVRQARAGVPVWMRLTELLASFSFSLYAIHVPVIALLRHGAARMLLSDRLSPYQWRDYLLYLAAMLLILAIAFVFARCVESHTARNRQMVNDLIERCRLALRRGLA